MPNHSIVVLLNNYSYFQRDKITGPKSLIRLLTLLSEANFKIILMFNSRSQDNVPDSSEFPFKCEIVSNDLYLKIKLISRCKLIISDRTNIFKGILLSILFNKKHIVRLLGTARRLKSKSLLSYRNLLLVLTNVKPLDLLISTNDGSSYGQYSYLKSKKSLFRINGIEDIKYYIRDNSLNFQNFIFLGRGDDEKGLEDAIKFFSSLNEKAPSTHLTIIGADHKNVEGICKRLKLEGIEKNIDSRGFIYDESKYAFISKSRWMISGNKLGCLGNSEIECLSLGLKIIYLYDKHIKYLPENLNQYYVSKNSFFNRLNNFLRPEKDLKAPSFQNFDEVHQKDINEIISLIEI